MTWAASGRRLGYQAHYVVDGGKARIVLNVLVAPAEVTENPAGKVLRPLGKKDGEDRSDRITYYRATAAECAACPLKPRCTTDKNGRQLRRYPGECHVDRVRAYRGTPSYEKALRKRKVWVEPLFAEAKDWHGMRRFRLRTLRRVNAEALMVAAGQNLKRLLLFGDRKPRKPAQLAALRPPAAHLDSRRFGRHRSERHGGWRSPFCNTLDRLVDGVILADPRRRSSRRCRT